MICTFFGHRYVSSDIQKLLKPLLIELIERQGIGVFYVGNQGAFDRMVLSTLESLKIQYPHIQVLVVLAYLPTNRPIDDLMDYSNTVYPDGLETTPPKFAISRRNRWMLKQSDVVVTYVIHPHGGAAQFKALAEKQGKKVINIPDQLVSQKKKPEQ